MPTPRQSLRDPNRPPLHPGAILMDGVIGDAGEGGVSDAELASALGVPIELLHAIIEGKQPITVEMAVRLGHVLGNGPDIWLRLQQAYDLWHAQRKVDVSKLKVLTPAADAA